MISIGRVASRYLAGGEVPDDIGFLLLPDSGVCFPAPCDHARVLALNRLG
jgi:hypothetical protein